MFRNSKSAPFFWLSLIALLAFASIRTASAGTVTITWVLPTQNVDNSAIPATGPGSLTQTRTEYGTCVGGVFGVKAGQVITTLPASSAVITLAPGTYCFQSYASNTYGAESAASNTVSGAISVPVPKPPTLTVTVAQSFQVVKQHGVYNVGNQIGGATIGAECVATPELGDGWFVLKHPILDSQPFPGHKRTRYVAVKCGMSGA